MARDRYRTLVLEAVRGGDKTQAQIVEATGLGLATVCRWIQSLLESEEVFECKKVRHPHGGPDASVYRAGPRPKGFRKASPPTYTDKARTDGYRKKLRASGEWEHVLARRRATYRADNPVRCPLTQGLFGPG